MSTPGVVVAALSLAGIGVMLNFSLHKIEEGECTMCIITLPHSGQG